MSNFSFILSLLAKHTYQNIILKMKIEKASLKDLKILVFLAFYFLILTFYQANIERWKLIQKCWSRNFCHCLKAVIVVLSHALTWFLNIINKWINNSTARKLHFIICLVSILISIIFTERVSIFGIHRVVISVIQKTLSIAFKISFRIQFLLTFATKYQKEPLGCGVFTVPN